MSNSIQPTGKGLELAITSAAAAMQKLEDGILHIGYGNPDKRNAGIRFPRRTNKVNGLIPIFREINAIDFCNIISFALGSVQLIPTEVRNGTQEANPIEKKILGLRDIAKKALDYLDGNYLESTRFDQAKIRELSGYLQELNNLIDTDVLTLFPKLLQTKNQIFDVIGIMTQVSAAQNTYENFNQIPNAEIQKLLTEIRKVRDVIAFIARLPSLGSIVDRLIPEQVKELQRILSPTQLLPFIRQGLTGAKAVDQVCQSALRYVNLARIISKVLVILIKVLKIIIKFYRALPVPSMTLTHGAQDTLIAARQKVDATLDDAEKRATQLNRLVTIIYETCIVVAGIVREIVNQIQILILNLESCEDTQNSPMVKELKLVNGRLRKSLTQIDGLISNYVDAQANSNQANYEGYVFQIQEEELVEKGITYKRRRAVAFDDRGILSYATQLTFATDTSILFEELKMLMVNQGVVKDTGEVTPQVADLTNLLTLPETDEDIYASIGMTDIGGITPPEQMDAEQQAVTQAISTFIDGLPGGPKMKQRAQQGTDAGSAKLKADIKSGEYDPTANIPTTGGLTPSTGNVTSPINTTPPPTDTTEPTYSTTDKDILTPQERARYQEILKTRPSGSAEWMQAQTILTKDRQARSKPK